MAMPMVVARKGRMPQCVRAQQRKNQLKVMAENAIFAYLDDADGDLLDHSRREDIIFQALKIARQKRLGR